ncbi:MAG: hypothetical protein AB8F65_13780 [Woeseiaceae bacterium]
MPGGTSGAGLPGGSPGVGLPGGSPGVGLPGGSPGAGMPGETGSGGSGGGAGSDSGSGQSGTAGDAGGSGAGGGSGGYEDEFEKSLEDFEGVIAGEQEEATQVNREVPGGVPEGAGQGASGSGGGVIVANNGGGTSGGGGGGGGGNAPGGVDGPVEGPSDEVLAERTPDDIPPSTYDDIVARQLREAAQAEEDPEIREKLWDEYRKYTGR